MTDGTQCQRGKSDRAAHERFRGIAEAVAVAAAVQLLDMEAVLEPDRLALLLSFCPPDHRVPQTCT
eukprot:10682407-Prorocentrum_lima.AAC.1